MLLRRRERHQNVLRALSRTKVNAVNRRGVLQAAATMLCDAVLLPLRRAVAARRMSRVRPGDPEWPSEASWDELRQAVGGRLIKVTSPLTECLGARSGGACDQLFRQLKNPYFLRDEVGLTQSLGWVGAWTTAPSAYAIPAESTADVVAGVNFAREGP
jgi:hypothetical protein